MECAKTIKTFLTGVERCTSSDIAKSKSCLKDINSALNTASDKRASIDSKRRAVASLGNLGGGGGHKRAL